jgi:hypothetical protein
VLAAGGAVGRRPIRSSTTRRAAGSGA